MAELDALIIQTQTWWRFHKLRGAAGYIEALAAQIRLKALQDAKRCFDAPRPLP